jgi:hypothetical protein
LIETEKDKACESFETKELTNDVKKVEAKLLLRICRRIVLIMLQGGGFSRLLIVNDCFKNENNAEISEAIHECQK